MAYAKSEFSYVRTEFGVRFQHETDTSTDILTYIDASQQVGIFYDSEDGTLFKHGLMEKVQKHYSDTIAKMAAFPEFTASMTVFALPGALLEIPEILEELNKGISITGYALRMRAEMERIIAALPETELARIQSMLVPN